MPFAEQGAADGHQRRRAGLQRPVLPDRLPQAGEAAAGRPALLRRLPAGVPAARRASRTCILETDGGPGPFRRLQSVRRAAGRELVGRGRRARCTWTARPSPPSRAPARRTTSAGRGATATSSRIRSSARRCGRGSTRQGMLEHCTPDLKGKDLEPVALARGLEAGRPVERLSLPRGRPGAVPQVASG